MFKRWWKNFKNQFCSHINEGLTSEWKTWFVCIYLFQSFFKQKIYWVKIKAIYQKYTYVQYIIMYIYKTECVCVCVCLSVCVFHSCLPPTRVRLCDLHVRLQTLAIGWKSVQSTQATAQNFAKTRLVIGGFFACCLNLSNKVRITFNS